jgi:hypothetical protein
MPDLRSQSVAATVAPHVAERIERAQDMLARLGSRAAYEPNYAGEKLTAAARACVEALALLGDEYTAEERDRDHEDGCRLRRLIVRREQGRANARQGLACVRCLERGGPMTPLAGVRTTESAQVFEHPKCRADGLALAIGVDDV